MLVRDEGRGHTAIRSRVSTRRLRVRRVSGIHGERQTPGNRDETVAEGGACAPRDEGASCLVIECHDWPDGGGKIGRLELHWPDLPAAVVREAEILCTIVQQGFKPPDVRGATVESVEAGIIHSPIVGFFIDIAPVIRVIYRNDDPSTGRKPTLFLDRHGQAAAQPRAIELAPRDPKPRGEPDYTNG